MLGKARSWSRQRVMWAIKAADSFIFQLCPAEISRPNIQNALGCEPRVRLVNSPPPAELLERTLEERRGVGWATLNSLHMGWSPVGSGAQTKALSTAEKGSLCLEGFLRVFGQHPEDKAEEKMGLSLALSDVTFSLLLEL